MSVIGSNIIAGASGTVETGYQIARSLRFNSADSANLSRTPASTGNANKFTLSINRKLNKIPTGTVAMIGGGGPGVEFVIGFNSSAQFFYQEITGGGATVNLNVNSIAVFRDPSAWSQLQVVLDTTQATGSNRIKLYANGVQQTLNFSTTPAQNYTTLFSSTSYKQGIGAIAASHTTYGYIDDTYADIFWIDGQALDPTSFGEIDANTGVWVPKAYTGTYGTNGFWLKFDDNSGVTATTLGKDSSGNGNNWTPNNFSVTAGVGNDSLVDSPTNYGTDTGAGGEVRGNYATLNPLDTALTLANGNLQAWTGGASWSGCRSTFALSSGKWYWEFQISSGSESMIGVTKQGGNIASPNGYVGNDANGWGYSSNNGQKYLAGASSAYGSTWGAGDIIGIAFDADAGSITCYKNNVSQGVLVTGLTNGPYIPTVSFATYTAGYINFGQRPFAYTAPSGFKALCTTNLPTPAIGASASTLASKNFNVVTYTGDGTNNRNITGYGFQPDLAWIKSRSNAYDHQLVDAVRGAGKELYSNLTNAESTLNTVPAFISDGFQVNGGTYAGTNGNGATFVGWGWNAGGSTVTNTNGTISSQVRANQTAGISIVGYTGTGANATVGHGLGVAPKLIIFKDRTSGSRTGDQWPVYHASLGATKQLYLNATGAAGTASTVFNDTAPTSSVFSVGSWGGINYSGDAFIAYAFAEVAGFSKFGSYTGNGSADGPFVYCGFRPRFVMIKRTDTTEQWRIWDTTRDAQRQPAGVELYPNLTDPEAATTNFDYLSNGFKLRASVAGINASGGTYIFAAFAEAPFNYARAR